MLPDKLIVCPVCHGALPVEAMRAAGRGQCRDCGREYRFAHGVFNVIPDRVPDADILQKWKLWEQLQDNGVVSYDAEPESNLSVDGHEQAKRFGEFCAVSGLTLDVGCGPQVFPSYANAIRGDFIGLDPLLGVQPRKFAFVQGIAEYLPFADGTFDHVLFGTSLDHMLSPSRALLEARRVLRPEGRVSIWFGDVVQQQGRAAWLIDRGRAVASMLARGDFAGVAARVKAMVSGGHGAETAPAYMSRLSVPDGAADHFHVEHLDWARIRDLLAQARLDIAEYVKVPGTNSRFVRAAATRG